LSKSETEKPGFVIWLTGLSGSGKSTIADRLAKILSRKGRKIERLDGDILRGIFPNTGFDRQARDEHIQRVGYMASRLEHHGVIVIASFISPYREARRFVRGLCKQFIEVWVKASLEECKRRDVKGLYKKATDGQIQQFTGLDDPYEEPEKPELIIDTEHQTIEQSVSQILDKINLFM